MMKTYPLLPLITGMLLLIGCNNVKQNTLKVIKEDSTKIEQLASTPIYKVSYLEFDTVGSDVQMGRIVSLDLLTNEKKLLVVNTFFNNFPIWAPNGKGILFSAARIGNTNWLKRNILVANTQLYYYNLRGYYAELFYNGEKDGIKNIVGLTNNKSLKEFYFSYKNNIYKFIKPYKVPQKLFQLPKDVDITKLMLSNDSKFLGVQYEIIKDLENYVVSFTFGISILNIENNKTIFKYEGKEKPVSLLGWSYNNSPYIMKKRGNYYECNLSDSSLTGITYNLKSNMTIKEVYPESADSSLILISIHESKNSNPQFTNFRNEIIRYYKNGTFKWITKDRLVKRMINIYKEG